MAKIFWIEDQSHWIDKFTPILQAADLDGSDNQIHVYRFAEAAKQRIAKLKVDDGPDVAILDANMNGQDQAGFSVSTALHKKWPGLPVIFLSEHNGTEIERDALERFNAQDFISKHQKNVDEVLCWRIKAVLRQTALQGEVSGHVTDSIISSGALKIDTDTWEVYWHDQKLMNPDNAKRPLAPMPRKILRCLVERSPRPVTTDQMVEYLDHALSDASYRQHIKTLRRSFDVAQGSEGKFLEQCKNGLGIVTHGESNAYIWKKIDE